jgi:hypothetical protein
MNYGLYARHVNSKLSVVSLLKRSKRDISRVILNQEDLEWLFCHETSSRGNLTTDSQKLSMLFMTSSRLLKKPAIV